MLVEQSESQTKILVVKTELQTKMLGQDQFQEEVTKNDVMDAIWKTIDGLMKPEQLTTYLNEKKAETQYFESLVADIISIIDIELGSYGTSPVEILSSSTQDSVNPVAKKEKFLSIINHLRPFLSEELLKERLEIETLESLKLIAKKETFNQKYIKIKTRLFYKQQKFNLLREESEGYSKLITELGQTSLNSKILENIQSLIGCFNLDPNRVLDIILESFENTPSMYRTFIALLKNYKAEDETICQIIGFKFQSLNSKESSLQQQKLLDTDTISSRLQGLDPQTQQDFNFFQAYHAQFRSSLLYTSTAYLLKYEMIDLDLLMPHLYPSDAQITQFYKEEFDLARQYAKKLTMVNLSETPSDTNKSSKSSDYNPIDYQQQALQNQQEELKKIMHAQLNRLENQKVSMVRALVEIEDYKTALRIVERLPHWYLATYPDVSLEICKAIDQNVLDHIYRKCNSLSKHFKEKYANTKSKNSRSNSSLDDMLGTFVESVLPILSAMGPGVSYDTILFTKLIRICVSFLEVHKLSGTSTNDQAAKEQTPPPSNGGNSTPNTATRDVTPKKESTAELISGLTENELAFYNQIYAVLNDVIMPSLSMIQMNPCLAMELWNLLKMFPYEMRYFLYNNWRQFSYKHFPQLIRTRAQCQEKIKYLLKRLTKENVKIHGRQIGKLSHNNPIIVCDFILTQIQRYDNFILPIVDSLKFLTPLSYDVLSYCTIIAISDADKDKMKVDSTSVSTWLKSVATFCALAFKKYPIELTAIIQYVINQLKNRKSYDLLILQEIVQKMCGIEVLSEVNDLQLEAMAGGDILRQEAGYFNPIRNIKKCATRLKEALADNGLILPLSILLSQQRDYIVFTNQAEREQYTISEPKQHLKLTGSLYDQCQDSLVQFSQFLSSTLTTEEYIHIFPKIDELVNEYHMSADVAFFLSRPMYAHHIQSKYDELRRLDRNNKSAEKLTKTQKYLEAIETVMSPVIDLVKTLHSPKIWEDMSPLFYTTFWTLSMNDCFVPTTAYDKQKASLKQKLSALDDNMDLTTTKKKKEKEKLLIMFDKLTEEENKQRDHVQHVKARFEKEKEFWFPHKSKTKNETITIFLQLCIFSRCLFTQIDAYYCAKFIQIIHSLKTPNFSTIICYDRIFSDISYSIASLTENEARKYGRFILGLLETVMAWHADPAVFETECSSFPGFLTVFRNALNTSSNNASQTTNKQEQLDYENFRHVCHKWHYKLTKCFIVCLESEEYLQMRNSLIILTKILPQYPRLTGFCSALEKRIDKIKTAEKEKKQDIATLAMVYLGQLKSRKSQMMDESKFHLKEATAIAPRPEPKSAIKDTKPQATDKFKQPHNPKDSSSSNLSSSTQKVSNTSSYASKQIADVLKTNNATTTVTTSSSSSKTVSPSSTPSAELKKESNSSGSVSSKSTSLSNGTANGSSANGSSNKESGSGSSRTPSSSSVTTSPPPNGTLKGSSTRESDSKHSGHSRDETRSSRESSRQDQATNGSSSKSSSSKSRNLNVSPQASLSTEGSQLKASASQQSSNSDTPTRKKHNEYSPTSSVSSEEWPSSPRNIDSQKGEQLSRRRNKSHSRSSSPKSTGYSSRNHTSEKSKRLKTEDTTPTNGTSKPYEKITMSGLNGSSTISNYREEYTGSSSSKRKSSRERGDRSDRSDRSDKFELANKEKKDHRKREHSVDDHGVDGERKRSKSDEAKKEKKSSQLSHSGNQSSSEITKSRRSSKKHDSSIKEESPNVPNNGRDSGERNNSGKHRSDDSRRSDRKYANK